MDRITGYSDNIRPPERDDPYGFPDNILFQLAFELAIQIYDLYILPSGITDVSGQLSQIQRHDIRPGPKRIDQNYLHLIYP
jgi:hypothetical protein